MKIFFLVLFLLCLSPPAVTEESNILGIEAAMILQFPNFISWKTSLSSEEFTIGVHDEKNYLPLKAFFLEKKIQNKVVKVIRVDLSNALPALDILVFFAPDIKSLNTFFGQTACHGTLIVTSDLDGIKHGSHINFMVKLGKVRFEISQTSATQCDLEINSRLLKAAAHVY